MLDDGGLAEVDHAIAASQEKRGGSLSHSPFAVHHRRILMEMQSNNLQYLILLLLIEGTLLRASTGCNLPAAQQFPTIMLSAQS